MLPSSPQVYISMFKSFHTYSKKYIYQQSHLVPLRYKSWPFCHDGWTQLWMQLKSNFSSLSCLYFNSIGTTSKTELTCRLPRDMFASNLLSVFFAAELQISGHLVPITPLDKESASITCIGDRNSFVPIMWLVLLQKFNINMNTKQQ